MSTELTRFDATSNADLSAGYDHRYAYDADEVDKVIAEKDAEIASLKKENEKMKNTLHTQRIIERHYHGFALGRDIPAR